ncbi:hypothetical protein Q9R20_02965 [Microbacterium sp. PRF11]|uniref:hypothetical protein n=1 Tax=Microbacterium sp. PRF11 TaxID=2962593 RepID=UPI002881C1AE|nr:hypothetical protein [Microbacterium sp. PRF11]MDT0115939.1 hypothetical protein [Microbacterium sp. PRF11]
MIAVSRRKRVTLAVLSIVVLSAAFAARAFGEAPAPLMRDGDRSAAAFAEGEVLAHAQQLASDASDPARAVLVFLASPEDELGSLSPVHLSLLSARDSTFAVASYVHVRAGGPVLVGADYWGRACLEYTLDSDRHVSVTRTECGAGVAEAPFLVD